MKNIRAVLFDMIGTTVLERDPTFVTSCFVHAFHQNDVTIDETQVRSIRGMDKRQAIALILKVNGKPENIGSGIFKSFKDKIRQGISNFEQHPELDDVIHYLRGKEIKIGVASGLPEEIFQMVFGSFGWDRYHFDYYNVYANFTEGRPHPALIMDMCERLEVRPVNLLKVGDTVSDVAEGKNAGANTAVVLAGTQPEFVLRNAGAHHILNSLRDILHVID